MGGVFYGHKANNRLLGAGTRQGKTPRGVLAADIFNAGRILAQQFVNLAVLLL